MNKVIKRLQEIDDVSLQYRLTTEYFEQKLSPTEEKKWRRQIVASKAVQTIMQKMHPDGYWLQKNPRSGQVLGKEAEYGAFATTHFCLAYLSELGLTRSNQAVNRASKRYLGLQKPSGDWWQNLSCLMGYNIRTFIRLGYRKSSQVQKAIDMLLSIERDDGGYLCDIHNFKYKTKQAKSCIRGADKVLLAFAEMPDYHQHPRILQLVDYFLEREVIFKRGSKTEHAQKDFSVLSFPLIWRANVYEMLYALSKMGYGKDKRLKKAWRLLDSRRDKDGFLPLDWEPSEAPWRVGRRGQPNHWVTYYAELAKKYAGL